MYNFTARLLEKLYSLVSAILKETSDLLSKDSDLSEESKLTYMASSQLLLKAGLMDERV